MFSTTTLATEFPKQFASMLFKALDDGTKLAYKWIWTAIKDLVTQHWGMVLLVLVIILFVAFIEYLVSGRWALLGSVLYHYLYFGFLFLIALFFGSDVFANDWFKLVLFITYLACFALVGKILTETGIKRGF
jgi:hypothetical protein